MAQVFLKLVNMSIAASWLIAAVVVLRLLLKKAPKWVMCVLWGMVALRLLVPGLPTSRLSVVPSENTVITTENQRPVIQSGIAPVDQGLGSYLEQRYPSEEENAAPVEARKDPVEIFAKVWLAGVAAMTAYTLFSYLRIRRRVAVSVPLEGNVRLCDHIDTPFILGILSPKIYLPSQLKEQDREYVLAHERAHLRRLDHLWKPLGFFLLTVYWFNPLCWLAYILLCRDIEMACDEKVIKELKREEKAAYSEALLDCSVPRYLIAACPLAFGEVGVKQRVKAVLNYKKPGFWLILAALIACCAAAVCFLTKPQLVGTVVLQKEDSYGGTQKLTVDLDYGKLQGCEIALEYYENGILAASKTVAFSDDIKALEINAGGTGNKGVCQLDGLYTALVTDSGSYVDNLYLFRQYKDIRVFTLGEEMPWKATQSEPLFLEVWGLDYGIGIPEIDCEELTKHPEKLSQFSGAFVVKLIFSPEAQKTAKSYSDGTIEVTTLPTLSYNGFAYTSSYLLAKEVPASFTDAGTVDTEMANGNPFEGNRYYVNQAGIPDIYVEVKTPAGVRYQRFSPNVGEDILRENDRTLTWEDVRRLSAKGNDLCWEDLDAFYISDYKADHSLQIRTYPVDDGFCLKLAGTEMTGRPSYTSLVSLFGDEMQIDIRTGDLDAFLADTSTGKQEELLRTDFPRYYLTIGTEPARRIVVSTPDSRFTVSKSDGSLFETGETVWLEGLTGINTLRNFSVCAYNEAWEMVYDEPMPQITGGNSFSSVSMNNYCFFNILNEGDPKFGSLNLSISQPPRKPAVAEARLWSETAIIGDNGETQYVYFIEVTSEKTFTRSMKAEDVWYENMPLLESEIDTISVDVINYSSINPTSVAVRVLTRERLDTAKLSIDYIATTEKDGLTVQNMRWTDEADFLAKYGEKTLYHENLPLTYDFDRTKTSFTTQNHWRGTAVLSYEVGEGTADYLFFYTFVERKPPVAEGNTLWQHVPFLPLNGGDVEIYAKELQVNLAETDGFVSDGSFKYHNVELPEGMEMIHKVENGELYFGLRAKENSNYWDYYKDHPYLPDYPEVLPHYAITFTFGGEHGFALMYEADRY